MAWRLADSLTTLRNQINAAYPNRNRASDGTIGDAAHSSTVSQHNPNGAGVVTAMDITHDPANGVSGGALAEIMIRDPRTWYVIWNSRIWETGVGWQPYYGSNPHSSHVHISTKQDAASYDNGNNWNIKEKKMIPDQDNWFNRFNKLMVQIRGRQITRAEFRKNFVGADPFRMVEVLSDNAEADKATKDQAVGQVAVKDKWDQQIYGLQEMVKKLESGQQVTQVEIDDMAKDLDKLKDKLVKSNK